MVWVWTATAVVVSTTAFVACKPSPASHSAAAAGMVKPKANEVVLKVEGMACQGCVKDITDEVTGVAGVTGCRVELAEGRAYVTVAEANGASAQSLIDVINQNPSHNATVEARGEKVSEK